MPQPANKLYTTSPVNTIVYMYYSYIKYRITSSKRSS